MIKIIVLSLSKILFYALYLCFELRIQSLTMSRTRINLYLSYTVAIVLSLCATSAIGQSDRPIDGVGYNEKYPQWGSVGDLQPRLSRVDYADGISEPKLGDDYGRLNPRIISNKLFSQPDLINSDLHLSDFTWVFGQFIDHDITLFELTGEPLNNIIAPEDDEHFLPGTVIRMNRTLGAEQTGTSIDNPREHTNHITAYLDLSNVYGSDIERADWLRTFEGGKLRTSSGDMLPWNTKTGEFNSNVDNEAPEMADDTHSLIKWYVAGDVRANENPLLVAFHTLFLREHNRLCDVVSELHPGWNDERIYQQARKINIAKYQYIIYNEWLPAMGVDVTRYNGYNEEVNPQIFNEFSTAAFRLGHTLINGTLIRMDNEGDQMKQGNISLRDAFFNPFAVELVGGVDCYLKGMATQVSQEFDSKVIDDVRNFLFGHPGAGGLDLAAININRGRERGLPDYNTIRADIGLPRVNTFLDITGDLESAAILEDVYESVDNIDPWVGMLSEQHMDNSLFGPLVNTIVEMQFRNLRDGDRFYYENLDLDEEESGLILGTTMRDVLMSNTDISLMQDEVFIAMPHSEIEKGPELIPFPLEAVIYPNPVWDDLQIKLYNSLEDNLTVTIMDYTGKLVSVTKHHIYEGSSFVHVDVSSLNRGFYNVILDTETRRNVLKMIKR